MAWLFLILRYFVMHSAFGKYSRLGEKGKRSDIGAVRFDMAQEKIVKPESTHLIMQVL